MTHNTTHDAHGAGLFNMRDLTTETLLTIAERVDYGPKSETSLLSMIRRILIERGVLS